MLKTPRFVLGKILLIGLNNSLSILMCHIKPSILSLTSDPKSRLTNFGDISDDGNEFNTVGEFDTNLVNRKPISIQNGDYFTCNFYKIYFIW